MAVYRVLGFTLLPLFRWRIREIQGLENLPSTGGYILAANHQSWIDSAILAGAVYNKISKSLRFVAQSSKYRLFGGIPINEYDKSKVIDIALGYLNVGHPVVIFPEGNSNKNPELRTGKTGAARLALRSGAPVIPVGIQGVSGVKAWQAAWWFLSWWKPCRVVIGQPVIFEKMELSGHDDTELQRVTANIMMHISEVSGKPYNPESPFQRLEPSKVFLEKLVWGTLFPLLRWRVRVGGAENLPAGAFIVAGNHSSYFDPAAVMMAVMKSGRPRPFFLTKESIARVWRKLLGRNAWQGLGMLPIDNSDKSKVVNSAIKHIHAGGVVGLFPEGTRNKPKINPDWETTLLKGRTGVARLAAATGAPVIPAAIRAPRGHGLGETIINVLKFWKPVYVTFGPAVPLPTVLPEPTKEELATITTAVMTRLAAMTGMKYPY